MKSEIVILYIFHLGGSIIKLPLDATHADFTLLVRKALEQKDTPEEAEDSDKEYKSYC